MVNDKEVVMPGGSHIQYHSQEVVINNQEVVINKRWLPINTLAGDRRETVITWRWW